MNKIDLLIMVHNSWTAEETLFMFQFYWEGYVECLINYRFGYYKQAPPTFEQWKSLPGYWNNLQPE